MPEISPSRFLITAGWDDVPHLDEKTKADLLAGTAPHERDARTKGLPSLAAGAVYPIPTEEFVIDPIELPAWYSRVYALDVGWNRTAVVWGALDRETGIVYLYSEHYRGKAEPSIHVEAIKTRGPWIPGVIDPAARGRSQADGAQLLTTYRSLGLELTPAENAVEAGIMEVFQRLSVGKIKVFKTMQKWLAEYRFYRRDEDGKIVKAHDHLMDATRYLVVSGLKKARVRSMDKPAMVQAHGPSDSRVGY